MEGDKKMWATILAIIAFLSGGSGLAVYEAVTYLGDQRWVTIASQNKELKFRIQDELSMLRTAQEHNNCDTECVKRIAVLEDRLKQLAK